MDNVAKLAENQNKIVEKILDMEKQIKSLQNRVGGLETLAVNQKGQEAVDFHQSFNDAKLRETIK
jgi:hypothetical protein